MAGRLIAVGDVHGCATALESLLELVAPDAQDRLVLLGDYVDRGPESRQVIDRVLNLRERFDVVTLIGNHEEMMLSAIKGRTPIGWWWKYGGRETLESYGVKDDLDAIPREHCEFLEGLLDYHEEPEYFFVHANYVPDEPLDHQPAEALRWLSLADRVPPPHMSGKTAIVGHTSQKDGEILDIGHLRCLDTFCHGGGWLTAMEVTTGDVWQVDREGRRRDGAP